MRKPSRKKSCGAKATTPSKLRKIMSKSLVANVNKSLVAVTTLIKLTKSLMIARGKGTDANGKVHFGEMADATGASTNKK